MERTTARTSMLICAVALLSACATAPPGGHTAGPDNAPTAAVEPTPPPAPAPPPPTPYTAVQIRDANPPGTRLLVEVEEAYGDMFRHEIVFVGGDDERAIIEVNPVPTDGRVRTPDVQRSVSTWTELRDHAAFPAGTTRERMTCTVPAGTYEGWKYVVPQPTGEASVACHYFADDRPGPPVMIELIKDGRVAMRTSLVDFSHDDTLATDDPTALDTRAVPEAGPETGLSSEKISEFGRYEGYSRERFSTWVATSRYLEMRDGVKLAIDVVRPAVDGVPVEERLPVVWTHSRYHRNPKTLTRLFGGNPDEIDSMVDAMPDLQRLVRHGYVVAAAGVRGSGASFGRFEGLFSPNETQDAYEIIEWLGSQPWSDGNVGMFGGSYLGMTQYMAASLDPPALKAIFPVVAGFDLYDLVYPGGVYRQDMIVHWGGLTKNLDTLWHAPAVDGDDALLAAAVADHLDNLDVIDVYRASPYRDTKVDDHSYATHNPAPFLDAINRAKVPAYHWNGWFDVFVMDAVLWYANYDGPQKLCVGAWTHGGALDRAGMLERQRLMEIEQHRWFDYWLKGIDNGVMDEPPVNYQTMDEPGVTSWHQSNQWPPSNSTPARYYFSGGPAESAGSVNDGRLATDAPTGEAEFDTWVVDLTTTTGSASRWDNAVGAAMTMRYPDMSANDARGLTYTTPALDRDVTVTGHPVVTLYVTSSDRDGDFYAILEEVDDDGVSHYVTEGVLRASHRRLSEAPWDNLGLPYQRSFAEDREDLPRDVPVALTFDLHPTSTVFNEGHRIRVTITGADADNTEPPPVSSPPTIRVWRDAGRASGIVLPIAR